MRNSNKMLDSFYGNEKAKNTLALGLQGGRLPHALLLEGDAGCGKKTFAKIIAAAAVCEADYKPCGVCRNCVKTADGMHPDVILYDGAVPKNLNVDAVRALRLSASVRPNEAQRKVYILADAQNMTPQAQNALLKVLEEPPRGVMFVLTCDNRSRLLETIVSRVTTIRLEAPPQEDCIRALRERAAGYSDSEYSMAAEAFEGNIGRAAASLHDDGFKKIVEAAKNIIKAAVRGSEYELLSELAVFEGDKDSFAACLRRVRHEFAGLMRQKYLPKEDKQGREPLDNYISALQCGRFVGIIEQALYMMEQNMGYPLASAWLCAQMKNALR
ncbi:MAG: hypothetical protein RSB36_06045 [Hydrogenoanaerobacterium sp.]